MKKFIIKLIVLVSVVAVFQHFSLRLWDEIKVKKQTYLTGKHIVYSHNDARVLGINNESGFLQINFANVITQGSPLIFGGTQVPDLTHNDAWAKIKETGVTIVRKDFFPEYTVPNTTISDYLRNKNNITNPQNWRTNDIQRTKNNYHFAKNAGMYAMGIVSYAPPWLTYTGNQHGVPKDWNIYEDIIGKLYRIYREDLDYLEIWNEPTYRIFLDPTGSGLSREEAYLQIFLHATSAIRQVDNEINDGKRIKIGGQMSHLSDNLSIAEYILQNSEARSELDFVSFHHYGPNPPNYVPWKNLLKKYNVPDLPLVVSEWNISSEVNKNRSELTGSAAIPYTGKILIDYLNNGIYGANYYSLFPIDKSFKNSGHGFLAFYTWGNNTATLLPQAKTWYLLSQQLKLGKGISDIYKSQSAPQIYAAGFKNIEGTLGFVLRNPSSFVEKVDIELSNVPFSYASIRTFQANLTSNPDKEVSETILNPNNGNLSFVAAVEPETVIGILISPTGQIRYGFDDLLRKFYSL